MTFTHYAKEIAGGEAFDETFGPYVQVNIVDGKMEVTASDGEGTGGSMHTFILATQSEGGWTIHDGLET